MSVYGTGNRDLKLRGFSREHGYRRCRLAQGLGVLSRLGSARGFACAPRHLPRFNGLFRQPAGVSLLRHPFAVTAGSGMFTASSIAVASRLRLRSRLTLIRLALIRKPWSYGGKVSRLPYRYLCLHLLFNALQHASRHTFNAHRMLPYQSCTGMIPRLRYRAYARLLSTRDRSTGELLRTPWMNGCFQANIPAVSAVTLRYCLQLSPDSGTLASGLSCSSLGHGR